MEVAWSAQPPGQRIPHRASAPCGRRHRDPLHWRTVTDRSRARTASTTSAGAEPGRTAAGTFAAGNRLSARRTNPETGKVGANSWRRALDPGEERWRSSLRARLVQHGFAWRVADALAAEGLHNRRLTEYAETLRETDLAAWWACRREVSEAARQLAELEDRAEHGRRKSANRPRPGESEVDQVSRGDPLLLPDPPAAQSDPGDDDATATSSAL